MHSIGRRAISEMRFPKQPELKTQPQPQLHLQFHVHSYQLCWRSPAASDVEIYALSWLQVTMSAFKAQLV